MPCPLSLGRTVSISSSAVTSLRDGLDGKDPQPWPGVDALSRAGVSRRSATFAARGGRTRPPQTGVRSCAASTRRGAARVGENRAGTLHLGAGGETSSAGALAQWAARIDLFQDRALTANLVSTDPVQPAFLTSLTYQSVTLPGRDYAELDSLTTSL